MKGSMKKLMAGILSLSMMVGAFASGTVTTGAAANKAVRVPVKFAAADWNDPHWETAITNLGFSMGENLTLEKGNTISYDVYIPQTMLKKDNAAFLTTGNVSVMETDDNWTYIGDLASQIQIEMIKDGKNFWIARWDEEKQMDIDADEYASYKKSGDYYVLSVKDLPVDDATHSWGEDGEKVTELDFSKKYHLNASITVEGVNAKSSQFVYIDNVVIKSAGNTIVKQNFSKLPNDGTWYTNNNGEEKSAFVEMFSNKIVKVSKSSLTIKKGKKATIKTTVSPSAKVTYKSSNKKVATVTSKGVVKGVKKGTATITVTANGVSKKVKVTVK